MLIDSPDHSLGDRIRLHRATLKLTIKQLARRSAISGSYLSKIERGTATPSLDVLGRIAGSLGLDIADLLINEQAPDFAARPPALQVLAERPNLRPAVVRRTERKLLRPPGSDVFYELLTPDLQRQLELTTVRHPPHSMSPTFHHCGEESTLCLKGSVRLIVGGESFQLTEGDCISFDSSVPHQVINDSEQEAVLITAETPANF